MKFWIHLEFRPLPIAIKVYNISMQSTNLLGVQLDAYLIPMRLWPRSCAAFI